MQEEQLIDHYNINDEFFQDTNQLFTYDGRIKVDSKAWMFRIIALTVIACVLILNLHQGLSIGDPLVVYSTLMPTHELLVYAIGWLFYRCKAQGFVTDELVSVIIPIYNQSEMIESVINAIFESTYHNLEVIAVNDGSIDGTKEILDYLGSIHPDLKVIHKENEGKRKAVATGFYSSKGAYIVLIDSDSIVDKNAITEFVKTFSINPSIGGVVGNGKVWNADQNILTKCQDVWYDYAYNIHKTTESFFGSVLCCSGCLAAYRREAIENYIPYWIQARIHNSDDRDLTSYTLATPWAKKELAPFQQKLMESMAQFDDAEDRGLTAQTLTEWETSYVPSAIVYTDVPDNLRKYIRQQVRWKKGYLRSNFYVSAFFWRKNPLMALLFYMEFMTTFTAPLIIFIIYFYGPFILNNYWIPITYVTGQLLIGFTAGLDYKFREKNVRNWKYKPFMNLFASIALSWLVIPAILTYNKNRWLTR
jgi:hyaluronan synthase